MDEFFAAQKSTSAEQDLIESMGGTFLCGGVTPLTKNYFGKSANFLISVGKFAPFCCFKVGDEVTTSLSFLVPC